MLLIVGLGNPGKEYVNTRHNAGFVVVDALATHLGANWKEDKHAHALVAEVYVDGNKIVLAKPQTFMNLSGEAVASLCGRFHLHADNVWAAYDEAAIDLGTIRLRQGGSAGGHNGIKSLIQHIGESFWRIRIGVGAPPARIPLEDYVLQRFPAADQKIINACTKAITELVSNKIHSGLQETTLRIAIS